MKKKVREVGSNVSAQDVKVKKKRKFLNSLSKKLIIIFIVMTILISFSSCIIGYLKYSSTIRQLYSENSYSIANIVKEYITPQTGDFLENLIVYETNEDGSFKLNEHKRKIPKMVKEGDTVKAEVNLDMFADPQSLSGQALEDYNKYYSILETIDKIKSSSGAKYIFFAIPCDGDTPGDPYYVEGQEKYSNPYLVYFAEARWDDKTLKENGLDDDAIIAIAADLGVSLKKEDLRDASGNIYPEIYNNFCRTYLGMQTVSAANQYPDALNLYLTGEKCDKFLETDTEFGDIMEAYVPIPNSEGINVGFIYVGVEMEIIRSTLLSYVLTAIAASVGLVILIMLISLLLMEHNVIKPIRTVADSSVKFIGDSAMGEFSTSELAERKEAIEQKLLQIKTGDEIENLAVSFNLMMSDMIDYVSEIETVTAEKNRIGAELDVATKIQASMLPSSFPAYPERDEFDVFATMTPAKEVGGDFYDFFMVDETHIAVVMADVSGKGVPAALFMVIAKTLIKDHTLPDSDLGNVFSTVNDLLCESNSGGLFVTAFEGVLDLVTGEFCYANAGHETPFICKKDGVFEPYKIKSGFVLAGMEGMMYKYGSIMLEPGDKIFQYTDGVTEATDSHNELYGMDRLERILSANSGLNPTELLPAVKADIDEFVGTAPQFDDITMLCLEYKKKMQADG